MQRSNKRIRKDSTMVSSSEWTYDKRLNEKDLHPSVVKFCAGLPIYSLKERSRDWVVMNGNGTEWVNLFFEHTGYATNRACRTPSLMGQIIFPEHIVFYYCFHRKTVNFNNSFYIFQKFLWRILLSKLLLSVCHFILV
jgi:hypothetical protein